MARTRQVFIANDDTEWDTEAEAEARNAELEMVDSVEQYISEHEVPKGPAGFLRKHLPGYAGWMKAKELAKNATE